MLLFLAMLLLPSTSLAQAQANNAAATRFVQGEGNHGSSWSDIWQDGAGNYGIAWDDSIAPAFTVTQAQDGSGKTLVNGVALIEAQPIVKDAQGNVTSGVWSVYVPPAPADPTK